MDKCAGQLNQPLVKRAVGPVFVLEPQMFQHFVRFEKKLPVEAIEITGVMRIELFVPELLHHFGDACAFAIHGLKVKSKAQKSRFALTTSLPCDTLRAWQNL